jgi:predicted  nucleic acid-binding Zn-ribbon protein
MATKLLQKSAHVAVGLPISAAKVMMEKARELRTELSKSGDRLSSDLHTRFEEWVEEGEKLVDSLISAGSENVEKVVDLRHRTEERAEKAAESVKTHAQSTATKTAETARAVAKGVTEPRIDVTEINGIGPATAKKLAKDLQGSIDAKDEILLSLSSDKEEKDGELKTLTEQADARCAEIDAAMVEVNDKLTEMDRQRDAFLKELPKNLRKRYELLMTRRAGLAIVEAQGGACLGCHMHLPPQMFNSLYVTKEILSCPHCNRLLYVEAPS